MNNRKFHAVISDGVFDGLTFCGRDASVSVIAGYKSFLILSDFFKCLHCVAALKREGLAIDWTAYVAKSSFRSSHGQEARAGA